MAEKPDIEAYRIGQFTAETASRQPTPGGGSVAAVAGALAASLGEMSANFTKGKDSAPDNIDHLSERIKRARAMFLSLAGDDIAAYGMYAEATKAPKGDERDEKLALSLAASIDVPREMTKLVVALLADLRELIPGCNRWLLSDLVGAASLAAAVAVLCDWNVRMNCGQLSDAQAAEDLLAASRDDRNRASSLAGEIEQLATRRLDS